MLFTVEVADPHSYARCGRMVLPHGVVETPIFMPVGTLGGVKAILHSNLRQDTQARIVLGNTYHLFLRPGLHTIREAGGLHAFSTWQGPMLTDSGGFQVFSLAGRRKLTEAGVSFQSHIDGSTYLFTPERVVDIERIIGADIIMPLDECPPGDAPYGYAKESMQLTLGWLERAQRQMRYTQPLYGYSQALFPIVQGAAYPDLRLRCAESMMRYDAPGYAIGGLAVGEPTETMYSIVEGLHPVLPYHRPRYLMGVGTPANLLECIARGVDMFDCVMPTRNGRNGMLFTWRGVVNIKNRKWRNCFIPIDFSSTSRPDRQYTLAYIRHLFVSGEALAGQIASLHNVAFYLQLMAEARRQIRMGTFSSWKDSVLPTITQRL